MERQLTPNHGRRIRRYDDCEPSHLPLAQFGPAGHAGASRGVGPAMLMVVILLSVLPATQPPVGQIVRMSDAEIRKSLVGRTTLYPPSKATAKIRIQEFFWPGGRYTRPGGVALVETTYRVDSGRVCIGSQSQVCRQIGRDRAGHTYFVFGRDAVEFESRPIR
jgi:hypothetical protein